MISNTCHQFNVLCVSLYSFLTVQYIIVGEIRSFALYDEKSQEIGSSMEALFQFLGLASTCIDVAAIR